MSRSQWDTVNVNKLSYSILATMLRSSKISPCQTNVYERSFNCTGQDLQAWHVMVPARKAVHEATGSMEGPAIAYLFTSCHVPEARLHL